MIDETDLFLEDLKRNMATKFETDKTFIWKNVELHWCKLLGDPRPNYNEDGNEWTVDITIPESDVAAVKKLGLHPKALKEDDRGTYFKYKRPEMTKDGKLNKPVTIKDQSGKAWDDSKLIGNGSKADIMLKFMEVGYKNKTWHKPVIFAIKINEVVEYEADDRVDFEYDTNGDEEWD